VQGRIAGQRWDGGFELSTQGLQFVTQDGLQWPGGNVALRYNAAIGRSVARGDLRGDRLDLAALAQIADRLPLGDQAQAVLAAQAPQGLVQTVQARWVGDWPSLASYQVQGKVTGLALGAHAATGRPGLRGASIDFNATQAGGRASIAIAQGALELPGVFEESVLPLEQLAADVRWQIEGDRIAVQAPNLRFANADARGEARLQWHTSDPAHSTSKARFPGVLDLEGTLRNADGARVYRYLPLGVGTDARHYVRDAVRTGTISTAQFRVKGDLHDLPFDTAHAGGDKGEFHIAAKISDATYAYVPPGLQPAGDKPWPALTRLAGELVFDRASMHVKGASAKVLGHPGLQATRIEAQIPDLGHPVVEVNADLRSPFPDTLAFVAASPLADMTSQALAHATGAGAADYRLRLSLPIAHIDQSRVQGSVAFSGTNELRITPDTPQMTRLRGTLDFNEKGFTLAGVQAQTLGGDVRIEGGLRTDAAGAAALALRLQGTASAEGLRQAPELGVVARLAQRASGTAPYAATIGLRRGVPELQVTSTLQ
ncbi:MAG TPA: DUF3971 domain-containing protein, partial [Burkholderiaceae bacterium]